MSEQGQEAHLKQSATPGRFQPAVPACATLAVRAKSARSHGPDGALARALGRDLKGRLSPLAYIAGIGLSFVAPWAGLTLYVLVALIWLVPDRRIEKTVG